MKNYNNVLDWINLGGLFAKNGRIQSVVMMMMTCAIKFYLLLTRVI